MTQNGIDLQELGREIAWLTAKIKELTDAKDKLRQEFFAVADDSFEGKEYLLPTIVVTVSKLVLSLVGEDEFFKTRYPTWEILSKVDLPDDIEFALRKIQSVMPFTYEDGVVSISRSPSEYTPTIDWENFQKMYPDYFALVAKPVTSYELDEEAFGELHAKDPSAAMKLLSNFAVHRAPALRVLAKKKDGTG